MPVLAEVAFHITAIGSDRENVVAGEKVVQRLLFYRIKGMTRNNTISHQLDLLSRVFSYAAYSPPAGSYFTEMRA
jgi:hypothetical protein